MALYLGSSEINRIFGTNAGGAVGEKASGWELLADVTTTEEVSSIEIKNCDDGSTIESKKYNAIVVNITVTGAASVTSYSPMYYNINGITANLGYGEISQGIKGGERRQHVCFCVHAGRPFYIARTYTTPWAASPEVSKAAHITAFTAWGAAMAAGTNIKIYGVRL